MPAPSVAAGSGGEGAKAPPKDEQDNQEGKTVLDRIGEMIDETRDNETSMSEELERANYEDEKIVLNEETVLRQRSDDEPPNRKKRMFEEPTRREERVRDEL